MDFIDMFLNIITKYGLSKEQALLAIDKSFEIKEFKDQVAKDYSSTLSEIKYSISDKD